MGFVLFFVGFLGIGASAYYPAEKDTFFSGDLLREVVNRIGKDILDQSYVDFPENRLPMDPRSIGKELEEEQLFPFDYDTLGDVNINPSLRDQEFLEHSTLWGNQYVSGGAGEGIQRLKPEGNMKNKQEIKTDATLPAYCNPPNPCPLGYTGEQGCLEEFENTASFSRRYQAAQDCMCDSEHMFYCPEMPRESSFEDAMNELKELDFNAFLQQTMQVEPEMHHQQLVAKKFHAKKSQRINPFLTGERLPVAAKKGNNVVF